jgi:hypothetical protein
MEESLGHDLRRADLRRHQGLRLEFGEDGRSGRAHFDFARRAQWLRTDQMAIPGPQAGVRHDAVRLLHSVPVRAHPDGDDPRQARGQTLIDATGFSRGFGNPTVNLVLVHVVYGLGFTTLFFRNYYETFPTELVKAAQIDGASFFQIFRRILLPNSAPIVIVTVIYQFTNIWNDFLFGSTFAAGDSSPMTVALYNIVNTSTGVIEYNVNMAAAIIAAAPTLAVYLLAGRYFVRGLMAGAVKG